MVTMLSADTAPEQYRKPRGVSVLLTIQDAAEADRIFSGK